MAKTTPIRRFSPFLLFGVVWGLAGCAGKEERADVIAQVGSSVLTLSQLKKQFPAEYQPLIKKEQYLDYIKRWMDEEILYQDALKSRFDSQEDIQSKVYDLTKKLVVEEYLDREFAEINYDPGEAAIRQYYQGHTEDFLRTEPEVKVLSLVVESAKLAWEIRSLISGDNFLELVNKYSIGEKPESIETLSYQTFSSLSDCIASEAFSTRVGGSTNPIKCSDGHHIVRIIDKQPEGTPRNLSDVRKEIRHLLLQKFRQRNLDEKITELKREIYFSSNLDLIPSTQETPDD